MSDFRYERNTGALFVINKKFDAYVFCYQSTSDETEEEAISSYKYELEQDLEDSWNMSE